MKGVYSPNEFFPASVDLAEGLSVHLRAMSTPVQTCIALIDLSRLETSRFNPSVDNIIASNLSREETALYNGYTYAKRQKEWLGGRLAAKAAFLALAGIKPNPEQFSSIAILPGENGCPLVSGPDIPTGRTPSISISHSGDYAVGMASCAVSCGIDIQQISEQTMRVADKFCTNDEVELLKEHVHNFDELERLNLLWAAKEALKKSLLKDQPTIFQGVTLTAIATENELVQLKLIYPKGLPRPATINGLRLDNYMLAYTVSVHPHA